MIDLVGTVEVAALADVDRVTPWRWWRRGELPGFVVANRLLFCRADVLKFLSQRGN
jgi:hypothetical protein